MFFLSSHPDKTHLFLTINHDSSIYWLNKWHQYCGNQDLTAGSLYHDLHTLNWLGINSSLHQTSQHWISAGDQANCPVLFSQILLDNSLSSYELLTRIQHLQRVGSSTKKRVLLLSVSGLAQLYYKPFFVFFHSNGFFIISSSVQRACSTWLAVNLFGD